MFLTTSCAIFNNFSAGIDLFSLYILKTYVWRKNHYLKSFLTKLNNLSVCLSFCLSFCLSVFLSVCLSACLSVYLSIYVYLSIGLKECSFLPGMYTFKQLVVGKFYEVIDISFVKSFCLLIYSSFKSLIAAFKI